MLDQLAANVIALLASKGLDPGIDRVQVDADQVRGGGLACDEYPEAGALRGLGHRLGGRDQSLARHTVSQDAGTADSIPINQGDLCSELASHERCLIPTRAGSDDHHSSHVVILSQRPFSAYAGPVALYAAYGSNLDPRLMADRAPASPSQGFGWLRGWRLTFAGENLGWDGALATVVEDYEHDVFVMLYDMTHLDELTLDAWEGVALGLWRKIRVRVETMNGSQVAWMYVLDDYEGGLPSRRYVDMIADAAHEAGAPEDYVVRVRSMSSNP